MKHDDNTINVTVKDNVHSVCGILLMISSVSVTVWMGIVVTSLQKNKEIKWLNSNLSRF